MSRARENEAMLHRTVVDNKDIFEDISKSLAVIADVMTAKKVDDVPEAEIFNQELVTKELFIGTCSHCGQRAVLGNFCQWCGADWR